MIRAMWRRATRVAALAVVRAAASLGLNAGFRSLGGWWWGPARNAKQWLETQGQNPLLYTVTNRIATDISGVEWHVYQRNEKDPRQRSEVGLDHPLVRLMAEPNRWHTWEELLYLVEAFLDLSGEAFLLILRDHQGLPATLLPIPPHWVQTTPTRDLPVFRVTIGDIEPVDVPAEEVIWVKNPNPLEPYGRGLGTASSLDNQIEQHSALHRWKLSFFRNSARPDVIVSVPDGEDDQLERVKTAWMAESQGVENAWAPKFLNSDMKVQLLTASINDMDAVNLSKSIRDTVFQLYGVPPEVLGVVENSNRATADVAMYVYSLLVLTPRLKRIRAALQRRLLPLFGDPRLVVDFESPVRETSEFLLKQANELFTRSIINRNEARRKVGEPPVDGPLGEEFLQPVNVVSVDKEGNTLVAGPNQSQQKALRRKMRQLIRRELRRLVE